MASETWEVLTTRNARGALPKVNDKIVVDGIPADVIQVHSFNGIQYQVTIPGLRDAEGKQQFITDWLPWSIVLEMRKTS